MEQLVRIKSIRDDGTAQVIRVRESACSGDCHKCSGCGAAQQTMIFEAVNAIGAKPGELVTVEAKSGPVLAAAAVLVWQAFVPHDKENMFVNRVAAREAAKAEPAKEDVTQPQDPQ